MRRSTVLKLLLFIAGIAAGGVAVFAGFASSTEVRGDAEPLALSETYTHPVLGFSFRYPAGLRVVSFSHDEQSDVVLAEGIGRTGFQVFTLPFDEAGPITHERIRRDLRHVVMHDEAVMQVGGVQAAAFTLPDDPDLGRAYEVWFAHEGTLYQVAAYAEFAPILNEILRTWRFEE